MTEATHPFTPTALRVRRPVTANLDIAQAAELRPITQLAETSLVSCTEVDGSLL